MVSRARDAFSCGTLLALGVPNPRIAKRHGDNEMNSHDKSELGSRLKRIAGQVGGIHRMLDDDRPLLEVLTQLSAVRAALGSVANIVMASHVEGRATEVLASDSARERRDLVSELVRLFEKRTRES